MLATYLFLRYAVSFPREDVRQEVSILSSIAFYKFARFNVRSGHRFAMLRSLAPLRDVVSL